LDNFAEKVFEKASLTLRQTRDKGRTTND
jgi:hypothetical protein